MIRICYIIGELTIGGAEKQLFELVTKLDRTVFEPVVITLTRGGYWSTRMRDEEIQLVQLERRGHKDIKRLWRLIQLIRELSPKIVHTYLFDANTYGRIAALAARVPIIIATERNFPELGKKKTRLELFIDRFLTAFSEAVICNSWKSQEMMRKYAFDPRKLFTIHNGIDLKELDAPDKLNGHGKSPVRVIGTVGKLIPQKNHKLFLDMAKLLIDGTEDRLKFMIVGGGRLERNLKEHARKLGIESVVEFTGERQDVPHLLWDMDIFVITSSYEGLSNAVMEAMAAGLPVVATDVGGNSELVIDGKTGILLSKSDAPELAHRVKYLLNDPSKAKKMGKRGRERIQTHFDADKMVNETERIYQEFCSIRLTQKRSAINEASLAD